MTLDDLEIGNWAKIISVGGEGPIRARLMDMGLVEGTRVEMLRRAPVGGPYEIRSRRTLLSLRPSEAKLIEIHPVGHRGGHGRMGKGHGKKRKHRFWE